MKNCCFVCIVALGIALLVPIVRADEPALPICTGQKVTRPEALYAPDPEPPESWKGKPRSALVVVGVLIDKKGKIRDAVVISSEDPDAAKTTLETVKRWRFRPAKCGKEPIEVRIKISVTTRIF